jgi:hypothetical protein
MIHTITLSEETYSNLQKLAQPFVDTAESVIATLADAELERRAVPLNGNGCGAARDGQVVRLNPDSHEKLTHARLLSATVDGRPIHKPKWNGVHNYLHILGHQRMGSFDALQQASGANLRKGRYEENGYVYLPEADLSIQGVDANLAWDHSLGLARALDVKIQLRLEWRQKEGAARPGETAVLEWSPQGA